MSPLLIKHCNCLVKAHFYFKILCIAYAMHIKNTHFNRIETKAEFYQFEQYLIGIYMAKILLSKYNISLEFAVFKGHLV